MGCGQGVPVAMQHAWDEARGGREKRIGAAALREKGDAQVARGGKRGEEEDDDAASWAGLAGPDRWAARLAGLAACLDRAEREEKGESGSGWKGWLG